MTPSAMPEIADSSTYLLAPRQADEARADCAAIPDDFWKLQRSRQPDRAWLSRMLFLGFGSLWCLVAALALWLVP
jgi:hypothetical protein